MSTSDANFSWLTKAAKTFLRWWWCWSVTCRFAIRTKAMLIILFGDFISPSMLVDVRTRVGLCETIEPKYSTCMMLSSFRKVEDTLCPKTHFCLWTVWLSLMSIIEGHLLYTFQIISSNLGSVILRDVTDATSGKFKCEISADTTFQTLSEERLMMVTTSTNSSPLTGRHPVSGEWLSI